jgi:2-polyprenyl-3-methyl-5-hydroxy-6-metoxy-1,4-benzoquinol methylase
MNDIHQERRQASLLPLISDFDSERDMIRLEDLELPDREFISRDTRLSWGLNEVEGDFVEYIAAKRGIPLPQTLVSFINAKRQFRFSSFAYRELGEKIHQLFHFAYTDIDERHLVETYKYHELLHLLRFISYSYARSGLISKTRDYLQCISAMLLRAEFARIFSLIKRSLLYLRTQSFLSNEKLVPDLIKRIEGQPIVVDYGCGIGYLSFQIAKLIPATKIFLVDVDCMTLEFAVYRFRKHNLDIEVIPVTPMCPYPELPQHNICIATEVMEHLVQPHVAFDNIRRSMLNKGVLYGDFGDHPMEMLHVSADLSELRDCVDSRYVQVGPMLYQKM